VADHVIAGLRCADVLEDAPAFVLGALEASEMAAVRQHLAGCPELHAEFAELGSVVPALFETVDLIEPPASLKAWIMSAAADTQRAADTQLAADTQRTFERTPVIERTPAVERTRAIDTQREGGWLSNLFRQPVWAAVSAAAVLAIAVLGAWNLQISDQNRALTAYRDGVVAVLDQAAQPGAQLAVLAVPEGTGGPSGLAAVAADGSKVSIVMRDLAPTTGTEVYEAWVISGDNAPVPIGNFTVDASGTATFATTGTPATTAAITVALSREPGPGATTPTVLVALGTAEAS
jgi:anti-sigma factor RsiW